MFDPTVTFEDLAWIKSQWPNKLVVKGIQTLEDAKSVVDLGVDGIVLSNHGGRQLDRAPVPFHLLPTVAREVGGDTEIVLDTGIMSGADIVAAIALGARFTLVGRAYLYGLMAGGEAGVDRAITILSEQVARTMRLLGVTSLEELRRATSPSCPGSAASQKRRTALAAGRRFQQLQDRRVRAESQSLAIRDVRTPCWYACDVCGGVFHWRTQSNGNCLWQVIGKVGLLPL